MAYIPPTSGRGRTTTAGRELARFSIRVFVSSMKGAAADIFRGIYARGLRWRH